jgi:hypothetical protein
MQLGNIKDNTHRLRKYPNRQLTPIIYDKVSWIMIDTMRDGILNHINVEYVNQLSQRVQNEIE